MARDPALPGLASGDDPDLMAEAVRAAYAVADLVFGTIHWGMELDTAPRADDIRFAEAMIDAGADGIFGDHQHRLGPPARTAGVRSHGAWATSCGRASRRSRPGPPWPGSSSSPTAPYAAACSPRRSWPTDIRS